jgi:hypothetical protein
MLNNVNEEDMKKMLNEATDIAKVVAKTLITASNGQGHLITAAMAMVMAGLEKQHKGTIKDVMAGAVLLDLDGALDEDAPPDNRLN